MVLGCPNLKERKELAMCFADAARPNRTTISLVSNKITSQDHDEIQSSEGATIVLCLSRWSSMSEETRGVVMNIVKEARGRTQFVVLYNQSSKEDNYRLLPLDLRGALDFVLVSSVPSDEHRPIWRLIGSQCFRSDHFGDVSKILTDADKQSVIVVFHQKEQLDYKSFEDVISTWDPSITCVESNPTREAQTNWLSWAWTKIFGVKPTRQ
jgi:hypothetical protein